MNATRAATAVLCSALAWSAFASAQWAKRSDDSFPRSAGGAPDLTAPAPKTTDGTLDLSGVWLADIDPEMEIITVEHSPFPRHFIDITAGLDPEEVPFQPWAAALFQQRLQSRGLETPVAHCKPTGFPWLNTVPLPYKIVQTPQLILILYEENTVFRQIFLDGRKTVDDAVPRWMGYSTGKWEGDELVVETTGFNDQHWLDGMGHPHSDKLRVVERFRRVDAGHLEIEITIDDPGAYTRPWTVLQRATVLPETDLLEFICNENNRDLQHLPGRD
jgi:hypothetical protein